VYCTPKNKTSPSARRGWFCSSENTAQCINQCRLTFNETQQFQKPLDVGGNITRKAALLQRRRQPPEKVKWFTEFGHLNRGDMLTSEQHRCHNEKRNFSAEFKRESAQLVVDQNYTVADAASAMDVGLSTMTRWVNNYVMNGRANIKSLPITPEQIETESSGKSYNVLKWKMKY
jgi:transposase-like protein